MPDDIIGFIGPDGTAYAADEVPPPSVPAPDPMAQQGVFTPGCDCGHDGMGMNWHSGNCALLRPPGGLTVSQVNALLGIDIWRVRSFRANVQIDFDEFGNVLSVTLLNPEQEAPDVT